MPEDQEPQATLEPLPREAQESPLEMRLRSIEETQRQMVATLHTLTETLRQTLETVSQSPEGVPDQVEVAVAEAQETHHPTPPTPEEAWAPPPKSPGKRSLLSRMLGV